MKSGKAPGIDPLQAELFKADVITASKVFTDLFAEIWNHETIPKDWSKGLISKIPKKGDLNNCRGGSRGRVQGVRTPPEIKFRIYVFTFKNFLAHCQ